MLVPTPPRRAAVIGVLVVCSGAAALIYQVLWVRQLGLLLGSTAQAAALAIAIFFAGLATGGAYWGRRATTVTSGLRGFGQLELAVAATALGHFLLLPVYHAMYPALYGAVGQRPGADLLLKVLVATLVLLPPSFLMGGTLPMVGQHLVRRRAELGRVGTRLYALNTAGSATGALAAGFVLPVLLGFRWAYLLAVGIDLVVGGVAIALARREAPGRVPAAPVTTVVGREVGADGPDRPSLPPRGGRPVPRWVALVAFSSGAATLAVEILWTRAFAQVLQNSVYTYALVLTTFLLALATGAAIANRLCRLARPRAETVLVALLVASGIATATSPWVIHLATDGLAYVGADAGWSGYLVAVAVLAAVVMLVPATVFGTVLPFLLRTLESGRGAPGEAIGRLVAVNTAGAIVGSLAAGFVLLPTLGVWRSLVAVSAVYPAVLLILALRRVGVRRRATAVLAATAVGAGIVAVPVEFDAVRERPGVSERVLELREGVQANVAVVEAGANRSIRVNNYYTLGSTSAQHAERDQTLVPLLTHPTPPRSVFFLGLGTGITAGAALSLPVERVVVCELLEDVVAAAEDHFRLYTNGLFADPRASVTAEDGRTCLRRSDERYDVIVSDLFTPWKAGTGNLYTRDHYAAARQRLEPGGRYVQWVPLYQVSEFELGSIARTMDEVFDEVVAWRGDFFSERSVLALVGSDGGQPLDLEAAVDNVRALQPEVDAAEAEATLLRMYAGNVSAGGHFARHPRNTDERPVIEYRAPRTHREARAGTTSLVVGEERERIYDELLAASPPGDDPFLSRVPAEAREQVLAGRDWSAHVWAGSQQRSRTADEAEQRFRERAGDLPDVTTPARTWWVRGTR